jgi:hypothetical protein
MAISLAASLGLKLPSAIFQRPRAPDAALRFIQTGRRRPKKHRKNPMFSTAFQSSTLDRAIAGIRSRIPDSTVTKSHA